MTPPAWVQQALGTTEPMSYEFRPKGPLLERKSKFKHKVKSLPRNVTRGWKKKGGNIYHNKGDVYKEFQVSRRKKWFLRNFAQEVHLQSLLSSNRIMPPVKALWHSRKNKKEDYVYLQMPRVGSANLYEFLNKESLSSREYQTLAENLIHKIDTISRCGFLWWDCKPANIVVTDEGGLHPVDCGSLYLIKLESAPQKILLFLNRLFLRLHLRLALKFAPPCFVSLAMKSLATMLAADFFTVKKRALRVLEELVVSSEKSEDLNGPEALEIMDPLYLINEYAYQCGYSEFASNKQLLLQGSLDDDAGLQIK